MPPKRRPEQRWTPQSPRAVSWPPRRAAPRSRGVEPSAEEWRDARGGATGASAWRISPGDWGVTGGTHHTTAHRPRRGQAGAETIMERCHDLQSRAGSPPIPILYRDEHLFVRRQAERHPRAPQPGGARRARLAPTAAGPDRSFPVPCAPARPSDLRCLGLRPGPRGGSGPPSSDARRIRAQSLSGCRARSTAARGGVASAPDPPSEWPPAGGALPVAAAGRAGAAGVDDLPGHGMDPHGTTSSDPAAHGGARPPGRGGTRATARGRLNRALRARFGLPRLALHASSLAFDHPITGQRLALRAQLAPDLRAFLLRLPGIDPQLVEGM